MTITIDVPAEIAEKMSRKAAQEGRDVAAYLRHLAVQDASSFVEQPHAMAPRTPGLHKGLYWIAEDFDAPLPDSFWLGEEDATENLAEASGK